MELLFQSVATGYNHRWKEVIERQDARLVTWVEKHLVFRHQVRDSYENCQKLRDVIYGRPFSKFCEYLHQVPWRELHLLNSLAEEIKFFRQKNFFPKLLQKLTTTTNEDFDDLSG